MYCKNCGRELNNNSNFCDSCGAPIGGQNCVNYFSILGIIFAFIEPIILGVVFGFLGLEQAKKTGVGKGLSKASIIVAVCHFVLDIVLVVVLIILDSLGIINLYELSKYIAI